MLSGVAVTFLLDMFPTASVVPPQRWSPQPVTARLRCGLARAEPRADLQPPLDGGCRLPQFVLAGRLFHDLRLCGLQERQEFAALPLRDVQVLECGTEVSD